MTTFLLVLAGILVWVATGTLNFVWYNRLFGGGQMDRDLIVALGPVGSVMLLLASGLMGFLGVCKCLGNRLSAESSASS